MAIVTLDESLNAVVVSDAPVGDAGAVTVRVASVTLTLDVARPGQVVRIIAPTSSDGAEGLGLLDRLFGEPLPLVAVGERRELDLVVQADIRRTLARLTIAVAGRGDGHAWDVEIAHLEYELAQILGVVADDDGPPVSEFMVSYADQGSLVEQSTEDSGDLSGAEQDDLVDLGRSRLRERQAIAEKRSGRRLATPPTEPLLLSEQKARSNMTQWRVSGGELIGNLPGPAGSFVFEVGSLVVEADMVEPTRLIRTDGLGADPDDPDRVAFDLLRRLHPLLVLTRDIGLLAGKPLALARAELAVEMARSSWDGTDELAVTTGERAVAELLQSWNGNLADLPEECGHLIERLGDVVRTDDLLVQSTPTFRGGFGSALGGPNLLDGPAEIDFDLEVAFAGLGGSAIDRTGRVELTEETLNLLDPADGDATMSVTVEPGPTARVRIEARSTSRGSLRIRLHRDLELLGEAVVERAPTIQILVPVAGIADRVDVEAIDVGNRDDAETTSREALLAELTGGPDAAPSWLNAANLWADLGELDRAAIAIERAALLAPTTVGWQLIRRSLILGTGWANGRLRPPESYVPVWRASGQG